MGSGWPMLSENTLMLYQQDLQLGPNFVTCQLAIDPGLPRFPLKYLAKLLVTQTLRVVLISKNLRYRCVSFRTISNCYFTYLAVIRDGATAVRDQLRHVVVIDKLPHTRNKVKISKTIQKTHCYCKQDMPIKQVRLVKVILARRRLLSSKAQ